MIDKFLHSIDKINAFSRHHLLMEYLSVFDNHFIVDVDHVGF